MCQRFRLTNQTKTVFASLVGYEDGFSAEEINIRDKTRCLVKENGAFLIRYRKFGYPLKDKVIANARSETVGEKSLFSDDFSHRRLLVPVNGFYEYDKNKILHYFEEENENRFYLAGIYHGSDFVLLTERPSEVISYYHPRMPLCIDRKDKFLYLNKDTKIEDLKNRREVRLVNPSSPQLSLF